MKAAPLTCDAALTITAAELDKQLADVCAVRYMFSQGYSYLAFALRAAPARPLFLVTRRDRHRPKLFKDQNRVMRMLRRKFPGMVLEAEIGAG